MSEKSTSRRRFLKGSVIAGAGAMALQAGVAAAQDVDPSVPTEWAGEADVIVVGAGNAGLYAALAAREAGADVLVLEKMSEPHGNTYFSGGGLVSPADDPDGFFESLLSKSQGKADQELLRAFADGCSEVAEWIRTYVEPGWEDLGVGLLRELFAACETAGVRFEFDTKVVDLITDSKLNIVGVKAIGDDGPESYASNAVILASGACQGNKEMMYRYFPGWVAEMPLRGSASPCGEGFEMGRRMYAQFAYMDQFHAGPINAATGINPAFAMPAFNGHGIVVDTKGARVIDESQTYVVCAKTIASTVPGNTAFIVMDDAGRHTDWAEPKWEPWRIDEIAAVGDTIEEAAEAAGIDPEGLATTIADYNQAVSEGTTGSLQPPYPLTNPKPLDTPPYYIIPFQGGFSFTMGGIKVDTSAHAINTEGKVIPGLWAVGDVAGGLFYYDYVAGSSLSAGGYFGYTAGKDAVSYVEGLAED